MSQKDNCYESGTVLAQSVSQSSPLANKISASMAATCERARFARRRFDSPKTFICESARAVVWEDVDRAWNAEYFGVLSQDCFVNLRANVVHATKGARVVTMHMGRALMAINTAPPIPGHTYAGSRAPGAVIVRPDQYDVWRDYASKMANQGIIRVVFLTSQLPQAQRWAARLAA